ncbi:bifunctional demethylmenaquinone methyltransferase/2-methoxy-6-polyprenyl-1,4-benzoquinol methylase UbiE [Desulfobacterales bacterium HSG17]|nr:bifunctional demethylmenaquinone methyltransferase/2-methoxy-6-polyprenyl-1,4-benzoquinol methylase UbiE [Desulfobacterales bacterium HSG17]
MQCNNSIWFGKDKRQEQLDDYVVNKETANFGFEKMHETEKESRVCRHFNSVAANYDMMNTLLSFGIHYLWKQTGIKMLKLKPGDKVLDVCGGTGDLSVSASKIIGPSGQAVLYDINWEMMKAGRFKNTNADYRKNIIYVQGDAEIISFPDNTFDAVMVGYAMRNLTHMKQGFSEMHRVLKPGGRFVCLEFSKPVFPWFRLLYDFYSFKIMPWLGDLIVGSKTAYTCLPETIRLFPLPDELSSILEKIGFSKVEYKIMTNGISVVHAGEK